MLRLAITLSVLSLILPAPLAAADDADPRAGGEAHPGWAVLFDGKSGKGWRGYQKEAFPEQGWTIEDGWLHVVAGGGGGDIVTEKEYRDFELSLEWKAAKGANSGIMVRASEEEATPWMTAPEFQIFDDEDLLSEANTSAGSIYGVYPPAKKVLKPTGQVNHARIVMRGHRLEQYLNGVLVVDAVLGSDDWNARVKASKFASMPSFGKLEMGRVVLQDHGDEVWFRNIEIREISPREAALGSRERFDLFNHRDLAGWAYYLNEEGAKMEDTWRVVDGILICKGTPAGYIRTEADHTNYHLVVEWRWNPLTKVAGNSGVLLRKIGEDKIWPRSIEAQLQSGSAGDFWNIGDFPMQASRERSNGRNTKHIKANEYPIGEWNRYDIHVDGGIVELRVNGEVLNTATECQETPGKICLQSEGAEIHFRTVRLYSLPSEEKKDAQ